MYVQPNAPKGPVCPGTSTGRAIEQKAKIKKHKKIKDDRKNEAASIDSDSDEMTLDILDE